MTIRCKKTTTNSSANGHVMQGMINNIFKYNIVFVCKTWSIYSGNNSLLQNPCGVH